MDPLPLTAEQRELDRLAAEWLEGLDVDGAERLAELLRQHPDLRERFARTCGLEVLLQAELSHSLPGFSPLAASSLVALPQPPEKRPTDECAELAARLTADTRTSRPSGRLLSNQWTADLGAGALRWAPVALGIAASLLILTAPQWLVATLEAWRSQDAADVAASSPAPNDSHLSLRTPANSRLGRGESHEPLIVRDHESLRLVSRLTHTALLTSMAIPTTFAIEAPASPSIGRGAVLFDNVAGQRERGYLLTLPPGRRLEMVIDANSNDENALAVVEIGADGQATGDAVSFSNTDESSSKQRRKVGAAGSWSVQNSTTHPRHFLLTGSHKRFHDTGDDSWYLSDYRVGLESPSLLCLGWDDSGYKAPDASQRALVQRDFDDISATLRIEGIASKSAEPLEEGPLSHFHDDGPKVDAEHLASADHACSLIVPPRTIAVLRVTAQCWLPNAAAVVDPSTGRAVWHDKAWTHDADFDQLVLGDRGVCVLENASDQPREYLLVAKNSMTEPGVPIAWKPSRFEVQLDLEDLFVVGFEDSLDHEDWDDVQFYVRMLRQH